MILSLLLQLALACDSRPDVCWALCRHDGYDTGSYEDKSRSCVCGVKTVYQDFTQTKLTVPALPPERSHEATPVYKKWSEK